METAGREKIKIGICAMEKKVSSLNEILRRLESFGEFEIIRFGDKVILEDPIKSWPICDCLIAFYSTGFPLKKAQDYAKETKPFLINELEPQNLLQDRREVYKRLKDCGVPIPRYAEVNREEPYQELDYFVEGDDFIEVGGKPFLKPFVEKPVDGDDHNIRIYYPRSAGGGMKELFRKVGDQSSSFHPEVNRVRRGGSFIYEEFMATGGTDVKHEPKLNFNRYYDDAAYILRKTCLDEIAPHLSSSIPLTLPRTINEPLQPSQRLTHQGSGTFGTSGQSEELRCVIAIIRHGDRTPKQKIKLKVTEEKLLNLMLKYNRGRPRSETKLKSALQLKDLLDVMIGLVPRSRPKHESDIEAEDTEHAEKLRQVKAVLEEGKSFSGIYRKVQLKPSKWVKIAKSDGEGEEERPVEALMVLKYGGVLTHAGSKQALIRRKWLPINEIFPFIDLEEDYSYAEDLGRYFRNKMYPGEESGLLRLHSTFRHDLKIYSSDEGRVQMSAAAFAKGLLDLDGDLTPILVSLVSKDSSMLDGLENASIEMGKAKAKLNEIIISGARDDSNSGSIDTPWMADGAGIPSNALELLQKMVHLIKEVTEQVRLLANYNNSAEKPCEKEGFFLMHARWSKLQTDLYNEHKGRFDISKISDVYDSCKYDLLHNVHLKLSGLFELFKLSQSLAVGVIPNEYGINPRQKLKIGSQIACCLLHNILTDLRKASKDETKAFNSNQDQSDSSVDLDDADDIYCLDPGYANVSTPQRHVRTRLYFTSESHIHSLMNVLRYCNLDESLQGEDGLVCHSGLERLYKTKELDYMSGIVLRMFENIEVPLEDPKRYRIEMTFSRGADLSPLEKDDSEAASLHQEHTLPIMGPERLQDIGSYLTLEKMETMVRPFAMPAEDFPQPVTTRKIQ